MGTTVPDDPLDRLETAAERIANRAEYEQANRRGLLWVHALVGMFAGLQMALWGSASTIENTLGIWVRPCLASLGFVGGWLLAFGLSRRPRSIPLEFVGLLLVGLWDLAMTLGLMWARLQQADYSFRPLNEPLPIGYVVAYPVTVYAGLLALITIHLWTLRRIKHTNGGPL